MNYLNFQILKQKDLFNDVFLQQINNIIKLYTSNSITNISNSKTNIITNNIKKNDQKRQKEVMIRNNIIPLSYLLYGYIYNVFYTNQLRKEKSIMNNLEVEMYKFVFSVENPIIKKINVFFYNIFDEEKKKDSKININKSLIP